VVADWFEGYALALENGAVNHRAQFAITEPPVALFEEHLVNQRKRGPNSACGMYCTLIVVCCAGRKPHMSTIG
jgi:hypothetical protein